MSFFTKIAKLFAGSEKSSASNISYPSEDYQGFTITPQPIAEHGQFRIAALIEKAGDEQLETRQHHFIRSDTVANADQAAELTVRKCKVLIDQMGDNLFS